MKKKLLAMLLCAAMSVSVLAGCSGGESETASDGGEETASEDSGDGGYKIGLSVLNTSGQFFISVIDAAEAAIEEQGGELMVNDAQDSSETQIAGLENFIQSGVDGIIVCAVDAEAVAPVVQEAKDAGIAVVCLTSKVEGYDAYIGADEYTLGYTQGAAVGQWIAENWGTDETIEAATLNYDLMESVIERKNGIMEGVQEFAPNVEFVADATAADQSEGMTATRTSFRRIRICGLCVESVMELHSEHLKLSNQIRWMIRSSISSPESMRQKKH